MLESRQSRSAVRVVVVASAVALAAAACASGGEGGGPSPFTSIDPPIAVSGGASSSGASAGDGASSGGAAASSTAMADGCADAADAATVATGNGGSLEAESPIAPEASEEDAGDDADADEDADGSSTGAGLPPAPVTGDLVVTEIMFQPSGPEPESEWFEIYNQASGPVLLNGLTIEDGYLDTQVIPSNPVLVAQPGQYLLLVRSLPGAQAALVPSASIVYAYGTGVPDDEGIELDAGPFGELTLLNGNAVLVDIPYGQWGVQATGQSIELGTSATTQSDPSGWCIAQNPWASGSDDGTPGAPSDCP
jgi:hypothetical protein